MPAAGLTIPAIDSDFALPVAAAQEAPTRVMVTTDPLVVAVAVQLEKPVPRVIVGVAGMLAGSVPNAGAKVAVMVSPAARAPTVVGVKPTAHDDDVPADCGVPAKVTPLTALLAITTLPVGDASAESKSVCTLKFVFVYEPAAGLATPAIVRVLAPDSAQPTPARVTVTTALAPVAVAVQLENPAPSVITGVAGTVKAGSKATTIRCPAPRFAAPELGVNVALHAAVIPPLCGTPLKATPVGAVAARHEHVGCGRRSLGVGAGAHREVGERVRRG